MDNKKIEEQLSSVRKDMLFIDHYLEEVVDELIVLDEDINQMYLMLGYEIDFDKTKPTSNYIPEIYKEIKVEDKKIYDLDEEVKNLEIKLDKIPKLLENESQKYWPALTQSIINTEADRNITNKLCQYTLQFQDTTQEFLNQVNFYVPAFKELKKEYQNLSERLKD